MITGIHHFSLMASSEASVEFYTMLVIKENKRIERDYDTVVLMDGYGIRLEVFIDPRHCRSVDELFGLRTLSLKVDSLDGIDGTVMTDWNGERYVNITDLDGNTVQLHE